MAARSMVQTTYTAQGPSRSPEVLSRLSRTAQAGVSLLALCLAFPLLQPGVAKAQDTRTVVNGLGGGGVILLNDATATALAPVLSDAGDGILASAGHGAVDGETGAIATMTSVGTVIQGTTGSYSVSDAIFTNFLTQGGAGSGGGAGFGGVFYVDRGATLTLNNVDFHGNTVVGGAGGSDPSLRVTSQVDIGVADIEVPYVPLSAFQISPQLGGADGSYTVTTLTLPPEGANTSLKPGMRVLLPGSTTPVEILTVSPNGRTITLASSAPVSTGLVFDPGEANSGTAGTNETVLNFNSFGQNIKPGSTLVINGDPTTTYRVKSYTETSVTVEGIVPAGVLSDISASDPADRPDFEFVNLVNFDVTYIKSVTYDGTNSTIALAQPNAFFKPGMVLTDDRIPGGSAEIIDIDANGGIVVAGDITGSSDPLMGFTASLEQAAAGSNIVYAGSGKLVVGMTVSGTGVAPGTTITAIDPADGTITLSQNLTDKPTSLSFSGVAGTGTNTITMIDASLLEGVVEGMVITGAGIEPGTTVDSISADGLTITLSSDIVDATALANLTFGDALSQGGSMNGIAQTVTGDPGYDGINGVPPSVVWSDGEGDDGKDAGSAGAGTVGVGGTGGQGGDGSSGLTWNPSLVKGLADIVIDAAFLTAEAASALASVPPDVAESVSVALQAAKAYVDVGLAVGELAEWHALLSDGYNGAGGDGGAGGWGGNGSDFFGGGVGGLGGDGGDAALPIGQAGNGGNGGWGGNGGFGGGGGMGGGAGTMGSGLYAADGLGERGGKGGFGGGDGANGYGEFGEGGAGFGGAIFVRQGGSLTITGNSTFNFNRAEGGDGGLMGQAGNAAGTDLFMMKNSTVAIRPGTRLVGTTVVDNVVTFNGSIGDDSRESFDEAINGRGSGASLTIGKGLVIFNGRNTYTGQTRMEGGVLQAKDGWGLSNYSNLNFNGTGRTDGTGGASLFDNAQAGVIMTTGVFGRQLGTAGTQVQWTGSGGFAAKGGDLVVNIGNLPTPQKLFWGVTPGFFIGPPDGDPTGPLGPIDTAALVFGSEHADSAVHWLNRIDLGALDRQILVASNPLATHFARMAGAISGTGGLIVGEAGTDFWDGTLILTGQNTFTGGIDLRSGTLAVANGGTLATGTDVDISEGGNFQVLTDGLELGLIDNEGALTVGADLKALGIRNAGSVLMMADIDLSPGFPYADDPATYPEPNFYGDFFNDGPGAFLWVLADGTDTEHTLTVQQFRGEGTVLLGDGTDAPTLTIDQYGQSEFAGVITGDGNIVLTGGTAGDAADPDSTLTLTGINTYTGTTVIDDGSTLALSGAGSISESSGVEVNGRLDIAGVTSPLSVGTAGPEGTLINDLSGSGEVALGTKLLVIDNAASLFSGVIWGDGDLAIQSGVQSLSGVNTYTGETYVLADAELKLVASDPSDPGSPDGSIADSVRVVVDGTLDIAETNDGAEIKGLEGALSTSSVVLGDERLTITDANAFDVAPPTIGNPVGSSFAGVISGAGGLSIVDGRQTLTGVNTYTGFTVIEDASPTTRGELFLTGAGSIAASELVEVDGLLNIEGTNAPGADIIRLGGAASGQIELGDRTLTLTGTGDSDFAGTILGSATSGLTLEGGTLTLTGASPDFDGKTTIEDDATLFLALGGSITGSTVEVAGTLDISGITTPNTIGGLTPLGTSVFDLFGDGEIVLGSNTLAVSNATGGTFSGLVTGTGAFGVSGGALDLEFAETQTVAANLFAANGGTLTLSGGTIDASGQGRSPLSVINGGTIGATDTTIVSDAAHPAVAVLFNGAYDVANGPAEITLGAGTVLQNDGALLIVSRTGAGSELGNVNFVIDNGASVVGDILDEDAIRAPGMGGTDVRIAEGVDWRGRVVAADFYVEGGASAHFEIDSVLNNLTAEAGAQLNSVTGNLNVLDTFTLNSNGLVAPGESPGAYNTTNFASNDSAYLMSVRFGEANPLPGDGNDYAQINVRNAFTGLGGVGPGTLGIVLERHESDQSTPLGNLAAIELLRIGGSEAPSSDIYLAQRFVQNGRELLLDRRLRDADAGASVVGTVGPETEVDFFGAGEMIVYGLTSIIQDETYALTTLVGSTHLATSDTLGTYVDRRGPGRGEDRQTSWMRAGATHAQIIDTVSSSQTTGFTQIGGDLVQLGDLRAGLLGSYANTFSDVTTETGINQLTGTLYAGGVHASWASGGVYLEALGQYGWSEWAFTPTDASEMKLSGGTVTAAVEAGLGFGNDHATITPWGQFVYHLSDLGNLDTDWVDGVVFQNKESMQVRGGVRASGSFYGFAPYAGVAVSHDFAEVKTTSTDGFDFTSGMGGMKVEVGAGFEASVARNFKVSTDLKGAYGIDTGEIVGYQAQTSLRATW
ncbi:autotransporter-associated beta strand repeat-containing protein [Devosia enhydra]|uniref:Autotransporter-associated beta strand repeat-containing protein n=1 Tax=Devosia enhydra TaxID=665118 RepID=A0A1K2HWZ2_9HYPH|nr:autotransporter-associated beta strand repeat-containing protein [Devosia enhydra]SFZ83437.1 autotransporter-associated beta strand repeat-containing protein [Devosia enhydra]